MKKLGRVKFRINNVDLDSAFDVNDNGDKEEYGKYRMSKEEEEFLKTLANAAFLEDHLPHVSVPEKIKSVKKCYDIICNVIDGDDDVSVSYEIGTPFSSSGAVTIYGKNIYIIDPGMFAKAAELADNFEMITKLSGNVEINFSFEGLTRRIE